MNFSAHLTAANSSCFFELNDDGRVVFSRFRQSNNFIRENSELVGHNFFEEIAGFENVKELRRAFNNFVESRESANNFVFECRYAKKTVPVRIMLLRILENRDFKIERRIILDIRNNIH